MTQSDNKMRILDRILDEMSAHGLNRPTAVILTFDQRMQLAKEADETGTYICGPNPLLYCDRVNDVPIHDRNEYVIIEEDIENQQGENR